MPSLTQPLITPELLSVGQVAETLGVSVRVVWLLAQQGHLRPVHVRTCTRWRRADVLRYIDQLSPSERAEEAGRE
jgi:excisionase family DNA binding protein